MTRRRRAVAALLAAGTLAAAALTACGAADTDAGGTAVKDDRGAARLLAQSRAQLERESYLSVVGSVNEDGRAFDVDVSYVGGAMSGRLRVDGFDVDLRAVDDTVFVKAEENFYRTLLGDDAEPTIDLLDGRWTAAPTGDVAVEDMAAFVDSEALLDLLIGSGGAVSQEDDLAIDGVECHGLLTATGRLYVDKTTMRPLRFAGAGGLTGVLNFTYEPLDRVTAPAPADVLDLTQFRTAV